MNEPHHPAPTAAAAALAYDPMRTAAPRVTARGRGHVAGRICAIAEANGIEVRQDADLIEILNAVDVGDEIPVEAFMAVAEVLAYVYRANATILPGETSRPEPPQAPAGSHWDDSHRDDSPVQPRYPSP